jgi:hypothetical protein
MAAKKGSFDGRRAERNGAVMKEELYWLCDACGSFKLVETGTAEYAEWKTCESCGKGVAIVVLQSEVSEKYFRWGRVAWASR